MSKGQKIHPTASIHPKAELDEGVEVGPYSVIGKKARIGAGTKIGNFCVIDGDTAIGKRCNIFTGAVIGSIPQDLKYKGEDTRVLIGDDNVIREYVTINLGTIATGKTVVGNKNLFMAYSHIAHDCRVGDENVIANVGTFAGHVVVENRTVVGGMVAVHQFVRIGKIAIIGGCSKVVQDVPPFALVDGHPAKVYGLNKVGLNRANIPVPSIKNLKTAFRFLFMMKVSTSNAVKKIKNEIPHDPFVAYLIEFIKNSERGICGGA